MDRKSPIQYIKFIRILIVENINPFKTTNVFHVSNTENLKRNIDTQTIISNKVPPKNIECHIL